MRWSRAWKADVLTTVGEWVKLVIAVVSWVGLECGWWWWLISMQVKAGMGWSHVGRCRSTSRALGQDTDDTWPHCNNGCGQA